MMTKSVCTILILILYNIIVTTNSIRVQVNSKPLQKYIDISIISAGQRALTGQLGLGLPEALDKPTESCNAGSGDHCLEWKDYARLYISEAKESNGYCTTIEWYSPYARRLEDCFLLEDGVHWYGGGGPSYRDRWPKDIVPHQEAAMAPGNGWDDSQYGGVSENYWIISSGVVIHAEELQALFFSMNSSRSGMACLVAEDKFPYSQRGEVRLKYDICVGLPGENFKQVHQRAIRKYYPLPSGTPDLNMMTKPFWSTWAEYRFGVNQSVVLQMAQDLVLQGFQDSSHVEIDGIVWETCYGQYEFDPIKFPDPAEMVAQIKELGFRTTLWTQPFINISKDFTRIKHCPAYKEAIKKGYLVKDTKGVAAMASWWQGKHAGAIDFTNTAAVEWWTNRLKSLQSMYGIDSFKFDAGEYNWLPASAQFTGNVYDFPSIQTTKYIQAAAQFGGLIEVRSARRNQDLPIYIRMLDKDSRWGYDNGMQSIIPTLLDFGIKGYPFVLPDMIGGNAYGDNWVGDRPEQQLYTRWMQMTSFMPAIQFSVFPWHYDDNTMGIVRNVLALRNEFKDKIIKTAQQAVIDGSPMNRPMWWVDPLDINTLTIDDQYMLGDDILVAPVLQENSTSRDIYLPRGNWTIRFNNLSTITYEGPQLLQQFPAPIDFLPFFIKEPS